MEDKKVAWGKTEHAGAVNENVRNETTSPPPVLIDGKAQGCGTVRD